MPLPCHESFLSVQTSSYQKSVYSYLSVDQSDTSYLSLYSVPRGAEIDRAGVAEGRKEGRKERGWEGRKRCSFQQRRFDFSLLPNKKTKTHLGRRHDVLVSRCMERALDMYQEFHRTCAN